MAAMEKIVSEPLQKLLQERQHQLNSLFLQARVAYPYLAGDVFLSHLRDTIVPIIEKALTHDSTRVLVVLETVYQISLRLVGQGLMGPNAKNRVAEQGWLNLLCTYPAFLCQEPLLVATSVANVLIHLAEIHPDKALMWQKTMGSLEPAAETPQEWLKAGLVAAWRCGLPHYRNPALAKAAELDSVIGSKVLGLENALTQDGYQIILSKLGSQPWVRPLEWVKGAPSKPELEAFGWIGGFVGFGGYFTTPPVAFAHADRLFLRDDTNAWCLEGDCFGVILKRANLDVPTSVSENHYPMKVRKDGTIFSQHGEWKVKAAANAASYAANSTTLVVVPKDSHHSLVLGLRLP